MTKEKRVEQLRTRIRIAIVGTGLALCMIPLLTTPMEEQSIPYETESESEWEVIRWKDDSTEEVSVELLEEIIVAESQEPELETQESVSYVKYVEEICESYSVCPELVMALIEVESSGNPDAISSHNAIGLMQVMPKWHLDRMERLGVTDLKDPYSNVLVGVDYLAELFDKYHELSVVLMCYNEGPSPELFEKIENGYVSDYANKIMKRASELQEATNEEL